VLAIPRRALVLDEPTAMLDPDGRAEVLTAIARQHADGLTIVLVTQEMDEVLPADRVVALEHGTVAFEGGPAEFFAQNDLLARLSLGLPMAGEVALELASRGRRLAPLPLTVEELVMRLGVEGLT
jgi:energy-coupling factor transport system ATP-binding protein